MSPGNPAAHPSVKKYLISISEEQAKARISPRQTVPFFFHKFTKLCTYLRYRMFLSSVSSLERYIISRDLAFFCLDFYSGERATDLGRVYTKEVLLLPEDQGLLFHQTFGKTLRGKDSKNHKRTGRGGEGGCSPPQILGNSDSLGSNRKFGQSQLLKTFHVFY